MAHTVSLPLLDQVRIASPCAVRWEDMTPVDGDRVRHCGQCDLHVFNFSNMSRAESEAVLVSRQPGRRLCGAFFRRADGTVMTRDCPVGLRAARLRLARTLTRVAAAAGLVLTGAVFARSRPPTGQEHPGLAGARPFSSLIGLVRGKPAVPPQRFIMGEVYIPPNPGPPAATSTGGG